MVYMVYQLESPDITTIIDYCEDLVNYPPLRSLKRS